MIVGTNIQSVNRFAESKDAGLLAIRPSLPEIHAIFPNKPVFLSDSAKTYDYEVAISATGTGGDAGKAKWDSTWGTRASFDDIMAECAITGHILYLHPSFNGYGGDWASQAAFDWLSTFPVGSSATPSTWYGYLHPDPADADANANAVIAMVARAHYYHGIPWEHIRVEYLNEWEYRNFGGSGSNGNGVDDWTNGNGYVSYPQKYLFNYAMNKLRECFPVATCPFEIVYPSFAAATYDNYVTLSVKPENFQIGGVTLSCITNGNVTKLNGHVYTKPFKAANIIDNWSERQFLTAMDRWVGHGFLDASAALAYIAHLEWVVTEFGIDSGSSYALGGPCGQVFRKNILLTMKRYFQRKNISEIIQYRYENTVVGSDVLSSTDNYGLIPFSIASTNANIGIEDTSGKSLMFWGLANALAGVGIPLDDVTPPVETDV